MPSLETAENGTATSWIKISEAAKISGLAQPTIYQLIQRGDLPVQRKKIDEVLHLDQEAFETWVAHRPKRRRRSRKTEAEGPSAGMVVGSTLPIPSAAPTTLEFWLRLIRFVREHEGKVALQADGNRTILVAE